MLIKLIEFQKALRCACLLMLALMTSNVALAADACMVTEGSAPLIFNYAFRSSYDISSLAVGSIIDTVPATSNANFRVRCSGTTAAQVVAGLVSGGGLTTNAFGNFDTLVTRVAGVGIRIRAANGSPGLPYPGTRVASESGGDAQDIWSITFVKISSDNTGNDTMAETASSTYAMGDNRLRILRFVLSNSIRFIRGSVTTCTPTVVPGSAIRLPTVSAATLSASGQTAGNTSFSINLSNCTTGGAAANGVTVRTFFDGARVNASTGRLDVTGTATNVQLQLTNSDGTVINLAGASGSQNANSTQIRNGTANLPYAVRYFATGRAGPGSVTSTVNFTMEFP